MWGLLALFLQFFPSPGPHGGFSRTAATRTAFVTGQTPSTARNDFDGPLGFKFTVGGSNITVVSLGRYCISGNVGTHTVKLVVVLTGIDIPGGSVSIPMSGCTGGTYKYVDLASPITLTSALAYNILSDESPTGGDQWFDVSPITNTSVATVDGPSYVDATGTLSYVATPGSAYIPVSFQYQ